MTRFLPTLSDASGRLIGRAPRRDGDGNFLLVPIYRVRAWRVPNEDGAPWSVVLRRAPPCDVRAAPTRADGFGRVDLLRRFFHYKWAD